MMHVLVPGKLVSCSLLRANVPDDNDLVKAPGEEDSSLRVVAQGPDAACVCVCVCVYAHAYKCKYIAHACTNQIQKVAEAAEANNGIHLQSQVCIRLNAHLDQTPTWVNVYTDTPTVPCTVLASPILVPILNLSPA